MGSELRGSEVGWRVIRGVSTGEMNVKKIKYTKTHLFLVSSNRFSGNEMAYILL
jgi:hypothetical protein